MESKVVREQKFKKTPIADEENCSFFSSLSLDNPAHRNSVESSRLASALNPAVPYKGTKAAGFRKAAEAAETDFATSMAFIVAPRSLVELFFFFSLLFSDSDDAAAAAVRAQHIRVTADANQKRFRRSRQRGHGSFLFYTKKEGKKKKFVVRPKHSLSFFLTSSLSSPSCLFFFSFFDAGSSLTLSLVSGLSHAHALSLTGKKRIRNLFPPRWGGSNVMKKKENMVYFFPLCCGLKISNKKKARIKSTVYLPATFLAAATTASLVMPNLA